MNNRTASEVLENQLLVQKMSISRLEVFVKYVKRSAEGCWEWTGFLPRSGYGQFSVSVGGLKKMLKAHRVSYITAKGIIPAGLELDHLCRNRRCVNPNHLEAVTRQVNLKRGIPGNKPERTHCYQGHELTPENVMIKTNGGKWEYKQCKVCQYANHRRYMKRKARSMA